MQLAAALQPSLNQAHTSDVVLSHTFLKSPALLFFPSAHKRGRLLGAAGGLWPPPAPGGSSFRAPVHVLRKSRASLFAWTPVSFASRHKPRRAAQPNLEVDGVDTVTAQMPVQSRTVEPCVTIFKHSWTGQLQCRSSALFLLRLNPVLPEATSKLSAASPPGLRWPS